MTSTKTKKIRNYRFEIPANGSLIMFNDFTNIIYGVNKLTKESILEQLDEGLFHDENISFEFEDESNGKTITLERAGNYWYINDWMFNVQDALKLHEFLEQDMIAKQEAA